MPNQLDYNEVLKSAVALTLGVITAIFGIVTTILTVFGAAVYQNWKEKKEAKKVVVKTPIDVFSNKLIIYADIFQKGKNLVEDAANNVQRFLIIRTINGSEQPKYMHVIFAHPNNNGVDLTEKLRRVNIKDDKHAQSVIRRSQLGEIIELDTLNMERGLLQDIFRSEHIRQARAFQFDKWMINEKLAEVWLIIMASATDLTENDFLEIDLFVAFARSEVNYEN